MLAQAFLADQPRLEGRGPVLTKIRQILYAGILTVVADSVDDGDGVVVEVATVMDVLVETAPTMAAAFDTGNLLYLIAAAHDGHGA